MKILGLIPARGGSKSIPGKNIRLLGGKPLIAYTAESAMQSKKLSRTIVSTDSPEIRQVSLGMNLDVPFLRPEELAKDDSPTLALVVHAVSYLQKQGEYYDAVCLLQCTSPFRPDELIDRAIDAFMASKADALVTVLVVPHEYNPHWVFEINKKGYLESILGQKQLISRRQDLPPTFIRDGAVYLTRTEVIMEQHSLYGEKLAYLENTSHFAVNLDTEADWKIAEQMIQMT